MTMTVEEFKSALPEKMRKSINQEVIDNINKTLSNPDEYEAYRNNLLSYTKVLQEGRFSIDEYLSAVRYVSLKLMGFSNQESYARVFPDRMQRHANRKTSAKDLSAYVASFNKSKLVNLILEQSLIPVHVINHDLFQKAINTQAELMMNAKSEKVRSDAANSLLNHLKPPEVKKIEMDIGLKEDSSIAALRQATFELVKQQRSLLEGGFQNAQQIAHAEIVDAEVKEVD